MKAAVYEAFQHPLTIQTVPDPAPAKHGVVIEVKATGICRSDWHGWMGHDPDVSLPHVPGHELAGVITAIGADVTNWRVGDAVTLPFVCGCGYCPQCISGNHQVCDNQTQPGFTHWGSFAEYVAVDHADVNLVALPEGLDFVTAASLGCRFATAFRGVVAQGRVGAGQWVAVHGCGGVGLSAIMIADALGANVIGIDINEDALAMAQEVGATAVVNARDVDDVVAAVRALSHGGAHVSIDALGHPQTCFNSIANLRKRGKHVQIGFMATEHRDTAVPMAQIMGNELEILGSHGMQAYEYNAMLTMIQSGKLQPQQLIGNTVSLEESLQVLTSMDEFKNSGIIVINQF